MTIEPPTGRCGSPGVKAGDVGQTHAGEVSAFIERSQAACREAEAVATNELSDQARSSSELAERLITLVDGARTGP